MVGMESPFAVPATLPTAGEWCTIAYAAERIGVSLREVGRMIEDGRLRGQRPRVGSRESGRHKTILRVTEVNDYALARAKTKKPTDTPTERQLRDKSTRS